VVRSDNHGEPPLVASHFSPAAPSEDAAETRRSGRGGAARGILGAIIQKRVQERLGDTQAAVDALDYYGYWKLFDALTEAAFNGRYREYALGGGNRMTFMGSWSDGKPVVPLQVSNDQGCRTR
jgi:hypothetical protein